jgi:hypothetical protein
MAFVLQTATRHLGIIDSPPPPRGTRLRLADASDFTTRRVLSKSVHQVSPFDTAKIMTPISALFRLRQVNRPKHGSAT